MPLKTPLKAMAIMIQQFPDAGQMLQEAREGVDIQIRTGGQLIQDGVLPQTDPPEQPLQDPPDLQETGTPTAAAAVLSTEIHRSDPTETDLPDNKWLNKRLINPIKNRIGISTDPVLFLNHA